MPFFFFFNKIKSSLSAAIQKSSKHLNLTRNLLACMLYQLRKYNEVIQLCEQSFDSAKENSPLSNANYDVGQQKDSELMKEPSFKIWRCCMIFKSYFYLGRLEEAIGLLEKLEESHLLLKRYLYLPVISNNLRLAEDNLKSDEGCP